MSAGARFRATLIAAGVLRPFACVICGARPVAEKDDACLPCLGRLRAPLTSEDKAILMGDELGRRYLEGAIDR